MHICCDDASESSRDDSNNDTGVCEKAPSVQALAHAVQQQKRLSGP